MIRRVHWTIAVLSPERFERPLVARLVVTQNISVSVIGGHSKICRIRGIPLVANRLNLVRLPTRKKNAAVARPLCAPRNIPPESRSSVPFQGLIPHTPLTAPGNFCSIPPASPLVRGCGSTAIIRRPDMLVYRSRRTPARLPERTFGWPARQIRRSVAGAKIKSFSKK